MNEFGFEYFVRLDPSARAVVDQHGNQWTRQELFEASNRIARALQARGLSRGDSIAVMAPNCIEYLQIYFAATQIGLYFVSVNWHLAPPEIEYILQDCGAKVVFVHERIGSSPRRAVAGLSRSVLRVCIGRAQDFVSLEELVEGMSPQALANAVRGRVLTYTSATTGRPKGIDLPLEDSARALERVIRVMINCGIRPGDCNVHLCASMLYHAAPLEWSTTAIHMGHLVVMVERWQPELLLALIDAYKVTTSFMVPTMFVRMLKLPQDVRSRHSTASLRFAAHSAAPCPREVKQQMIEWWGPVIWESYGSSEGGGTVVSPEEWLRYPGTVGRPIPGSRVRVLDDEGNDVPAGTVGTIYMVRYTGDRFRYRGDPEKTRLAHRGEFFTVGDMGYLNEEGYLFICDRKIDMIISGGINIYPAEVERVLIQHPKVVDCAVVGVPDGLLGEIVKAVVQLRHDVVAGAAVTLELLAFLRTQLAPVKVPRLIEYAGQLPRDPNGKIYKRLLRERPAEIA